MTNIREKVFNEIKGEAYDDEMKTMFMDGYDDCIIGIVYRFGIEPIVCYDFDKVIARHMKDGMTYEEAEEYFDFNQLGAWMGNKTPCFIKRVQQGGGKMYG